MKILINDEINSDLWNMLCERKGYFRFEWRKIISESYKLKPLYILVYEGEKYAMIACFLTVKGTISLPFLSYSGFSYNSQEALCILNDYLKTRNLSIDSRNLTPLASEPYYVTSIADIQNIDFLIKNLSGNTRSKINRAAKHGFTIETTHNCRAIYDIYTKKMYELGTPPHKLQFFESIHKNIDKTLIVTINYNNKPVGFLFCVYDKDTLYDLFASVSSEHNKLYANYLLYIETMKLANEMGLKYFDMGRSTFGSTVHKFKQKWKPTDYSISSSVVYDKSGSLGILSKIWQKLPYTLTLWLGPKIRKYLP